jgi:hypothetical protein
MSVFFPRNFFGRELIFVPTREPRCGHPVGIDIMRAIGDFCKDALEDSDATQQQDARLEPESHG